VLRRSSFQTEKGKSQVPKEYINPTGVPAHPYFTRVLSITSLSKLVYIGGQVPSDDQYKPIHVGDIRAQFIEVIESLTGQLKAIGATWDDVVFRRMYAPGRSCLHETLRSGQDVSVALDAPIAEHVDWRDRAVESGFTR
jgi:hypothetical protein